MAGRVQAGDGRRQAAGERRIARERGREPHKRRLQDPVGGDVAARGRVRGQVERGPQADGDGRPAEVEDRLGEGRLGGLDERCGCSQDDRVMVADCLPCGRDRRPRRSVIDDELVDPLEAPAERAGQSGRDRRARRGDPCAIADVLRVG